MKTCLECPYQFYCTHRNELTGYKDPDYCEFNPDNYNPKSMIYTSPDISTMIYVSPDTCIENADDLNIDENNEKEFTKEVMNDIPKKKSLKDFFDDIHSYKQFRNAVDEIMLYMDFKKIHRTMKALRWGWVVSATDNNSEYGVPSVSTIREKLYDLISDMERWINDNPDAKYYSVSVCGFDISMMVDDNTEQDMNDFNHRVNFSVKFVVAEFDSIK